MTYSDQTRPGHIREDQTKCFLGPIIVHVHLSPMVRIMGFDMPNKTFLVLRVVQYYLKVLKGFQGS